MHFARVKSVLLMIGIILLSCNIGLFSDHAVAKDDWNLLFLVPMITSNQNVVKRAVSGYVKVGGNGLSDVGIYDGNELIATTNGLGYYETLLLAGLPYVLTAQKNGYQITPASITINSGNVDVANQNFSATKLAIATVSGNITWKNSGYDVVIESNPLPLVVVEAYRFTDCYNEDSSTLYKRTTTDVNGNYSLTLPVGWCGYVAPFWEEGVIFFPSQRYVYNIKENIVMNAMTPNGNDRHTITIKITDPNGNPLPASHSFRMDIDGIDYAFGSHDHIYITGSIGEGNVKKPHGYIGTVTPSVYGGGKQYSFTPSFVTMNGHLSSDRVFEFTATEQ